MNPETPQLWSKVDGLVAQAPGLAALRHHRFELLAARQRRTRGLPVDPLLRSAERLAAVRSVSVRQLLTMIRSAVDHPLVLMKGPEVAECYQFPQCRPFGDLDIVTPDVDAAFAALVRAGFTEIGISDAGHHAPPLVWPGVPLKVELHSAPKYVARLPVPSTEELLSLTRPSLTGIDGLAGFVPSAHAVLLAAHAWAHGPLERLGQLVDIAAVLSEDDAGRADEIARDWGCRRLWRVTRVAIDALFGDGAPSVPLRTWARHLTGSREPLVAERSLARLAGPVWALPRRRIPAGVGDELLRIVQRCEWETRDDQLLRSRQALRHPFTPVSEFRA
jgi:Uncharacterised nucleotidyltransferase